MNKSQVLKRIEQAKVKHQKNRSSYLKTNKYDIGEFRGMELKYYTRLNTFKSRSGKVEFNPVTMIGTSYRHWTFVKKVNGKLLFNNSSYSMTTNRHQSQMRTLLNELGLKYTVIYMDSHKDLYEISKETTLSKHRSIAALEIVTNATKGARLKSYAHRSRIHTISSLKKEIVVLESLGFKVSKKDVNQLRKTMFTNEVERVKKVKQEKADQKAFLKTQFETNEAFNLNLGA